jgi:multidrug efflux system outer membrane protein
VRRQAALAGAALALAACAVGPDYQRPQVDTPPAFRGIALDPAMDPRSVGDLAWWTVFQDEELQALLRAALEANYDLRVAAARILDARARVTSTRSFQFPELNVSGSAPYQRIEGDSVPFQLQETFTPFGSLDLFFEIDFWGRFRRATEAARADLLASEEARHVVMTTLVSDVATAYFQLRELDLELEISRRTFASRRDALRLIQLRQQGGVSGMLDVRQAEVLLFTAAGTIPDVERRMEQTENFISVLLGRIPDAVPRGRPLIEQLALPALPPGLPSSLLERRPDIRFSESQLAAATARIGVAKADYFPRITLLASAGAGGAAVEGSWFGPFGVFGIGPAVSWPIFNAGRIAAGVDSAEARAQEALVRYQQTIQQAFREVADALTEHKKRREFRVQQESLVGSLRDATRLSDLRYRGGVTAYLEVLDTERQLFDAELGLAQAQRDEVLAVVQLYKALGGGWVQ